MLRQCPLILLPGQGDYQWFLDGSPLEGIDILAIEEGSYSSNGSLRTLYNSTISKCDFRNQSFDVHLTTG